jgi:hypothetical protein
VGRKNPEPEPRTRTPYPKVYFIPQHPRLGAGGEVKKPSSPISIPQAKGKNIRSPDGSEQGETGCEGELVSTVAVSRCRAAPGAAVRSTRTELKLYVSTYEV